MFGGFIILLYLRSILLNNLNVTIMSNEYKGREIEFQMDDVDDNIYFEGCDEDTIPEIFMKQLMDKIRSQKWFIEGNKTEGIVTFHSSIELTIDWKSITMGEDWDSDEEQDHSQDVILNMDTSQYVVVDYND